MGELELNAFLTHLAVKEKVSASTQLLEAGYDVHTVQEYRVIKMFGLP